MMKLRLTVFLMGGVLAFLQAADPVVCIPKISNERASRLLQAENWNENDWVGAAVLRSFSNRSTASVGIPEGTAFHLMHDGENLWLAAVCTEADFASARAFKRGSEDDLTLDEAVQVVIGLEGKVSGNLTMGGYEGGFSSLGKCEHLYEMTVNLAGASSRRYDETPLAAPRFEHRLLRSNDYWAALLKIPFASVGVIWKEGASLYFNAFRFYRGERYGWHLPNFGGYNNLPMGRAVLLDTPRNDDATVENVPASIANKDSASRVPFVSKGQLAMEYYPASGEVAAEVPADAMDEMLVLTANGKSVSARRDAYWPTRLKLPVAIETGTEFEASLTANGRQLLKKSFTAKAPRTWRHGVAKEYLEDRVPYPWVSPSFKDGVLKLKHGTMLFGEEMLPQSIRNCRGVEILSAPITLEGESGGKPLPQNRRASFSQTTTAVEMFSETLSGLELKTRIEYDGFMTVRARLTGLASTVPDTLKLHIPLSKELARYVNNGSSQQLIQSASYGYSGNIRTNLWVGDRNGGIIFAYGHPLFFSPQNGKQVVLDGDDLVLHFVSQKGGTIPPDGTVFEFHLQFTPFRDDTIPLMDSKLWFESWSDYQSYPDLSKTKEVAKRVEAAKKEGKDFFLYFGQVMAEDAPEYAQYPTDFMAAPRKALYKRAYNPGKDVPCSVICFREEAGEFMLDKIEQLVEQAALHGVYLDGPSIPFQCENLNHPCARYLPARWDGSWHEGDIPGQRSYMKRLRGIFDSRGVKHPIWHHTGGGFGLVHFAHCDFYWDGEHLSRYRRGYLLPPDFFSIIYSGYPFGYQGVFLPIFYIDATLTTRQSLAWTAPHGVVSSIGGGSYCPDFLKITKRHPNVTFYPYTGEQPHIGILNSNTLCTSYYLTDTEAVLISGNIVYHGTQENMVDVSKMFPGKELQISCLNREEVPDFRDGVLRFSVAERDLRIYHIAPKETDVSSLNLPTPWRKEADVPPAEPLQVQKEFIHANWLPSEGVFAPIAESGLPCGLKSNNGKALLRYAKSLPDNIALKMKFRHSGKFKFTVDGVDVSFDYHPAKGWFIENLDEHDSLDRSDVTLKAHGHSYSVLDRVVSLEIYVIEGRIAFFYDNVRILQFGLPSQKYAQGHTLAIETKDNDWIAFDIGYLGPSSASEMPQWPHPVH